MPIRFAGSRWAKVREDARLWWAGELDRPLIQVRLTGADASREDEMRRWLEGYGVDPGESE